MKLLAIVVAAALAAFILLPMARQSFRERKNRREAATTMRARFPTRRELPLSRADKRGWVIDKDGARPR